MSLLKAFSLALLIFVISCNKNLTEEESKELWSKAQTTGEIINRSGTVYSSADRKELALRDAENRLSTGGGLFGSDGIDVFGGDDKKKINSGLGSGLLLRVSRQAEVTTKSSMKTL